MFEHFERWSGTLLLPGVTAVIESGDQVLLARHRDTSHWSLIGGGIEPGEEPSAAVYREVAEELGVLPRVGPILGAYGGPDLTTTLPDDDEVSYVTIAYRCTLPRQAFALEHAELIEVQWFDRATTPTLDGHDCIDRVVADLDLP